MVDGNDNPFISFYILMVICDKHIRMHNLCIFLCTLNFFTMRCKKIRKMYVIETKNLGYFAMKNWLNVSSTKTSQQVLETARFMHSLWNWRQKIPSLSKKKNRNGKFKETSSRLWQRTIILSGSWRKRSQYWCDMVHLLCSYNWIICKKVDFFV